MAQSRFLSMNKDVAMLIGLLLSDGSVYYDKSKKTYCIQLLFLCKSLLRDQMQKRGFNKGFLYMNQFLKDLNSQRPFCLVLFLVTAASIPIRNTESTR